MYIKNILILCTQAFFIQAISAQCSGAGDSYGYTASWGPTPTTTATCTWGASYANPTEWTYAPAATLTASNGPGLATSSASPLLPAGVAVVSENVYEGTLIADGAIPFLGTVALEGGVPTAGVGVIAYGCGNSVGITAEDVGAYGFTGMVGFGFGDGVSVPVAYGSGIGYGPCGYGTMF